MKFKFKFEILLKQRKRLMEQAQVDYAEAQSLVDKKMQQINEKFAAIQKTRNNIFESKSGAKNQAAIFVSGEEFIVGAGRQIDIYRAEARELMAIAEDKHARLVDRTKDYKIIEKLKEKKKAEYKKERARKEQKNLEDINIMRFGRRVS